MKTLFPKSLKVRKATKLQPLSFNGFGGGFNAVMNDLVMPPSHQVDLKNMKRTASSGQRIRPGSIYLTDISNVATGTIVDQEYFSNTIISVTTTGQVVATDGDGVNTLIWSTAIAALLPGAPGGWSGGLTAVDFVPFKTQLIIHNGIDKPITVSSSHIVTYLVDLGSGVNTHTPIGLYGCVVSNYHCVAGLPGFPTLIYISAVGTAGTFPGDPAPNDSISVDVGAYAPSGAPEIRGIAGFRSYLLVFFQNQTLQVKLGVYNTAVTPVHVPEFPDTMPEVGLLGHRCIINVMRDIHFAGISSVNSAKRDLYLAGQLDNDALSSAIEPAYIADVGALTDTEMLKQSFVIYDRRGYDTLVFIPNGRTFVYSSNDKLNYHAWSYYSGLNFTCGCTSFLGRVYLSTGTRIYQLGNSVFTGEDYHADRLLDRDASWAPVTSYAIGARIYDTVALKSFDCIADNISGSVSFTQDRADQIANPKWEEYTGTAIDFVLEMPWVSTKDRMTVAHAKFTRIGSKGTSEFNVAFYVDNLYKDVDGNVLYSAALSMAFIGNDARGFGYDAGPYGGGRRSNDPRLYGTPLKFKTIKVIFSGSTKLPLELDGITFLYAKGKFRR